MYLIALDFVKNPYLVLMAVMLADDFGTSIAEEFESELMNDLEVTYDSLVAFSF